jgi:hypothetical protein
MPTVYDCKTKKDLRMRVGQLAVLYLQETSVFGPECLPGRKVVVVGPSAYERKWYAQVWIGLDGTIQKVA